MIIVISNNGKLIIQLEWPLVRPCMPRIWKCNSYIWGPFYVSDRIRQENLATDKGKPPGWSQPGGRLKFLNLPSLKYRR